MKATCPKHGLTKYSFNKKRGGHYCLKCYTAKIKREKRKTFKYNAIQYKGGSCSKCGYSKNNSALEFHHVNPKDKSFSISKYATIKPWAELKKELDKCILVCANCHREIHSFRITT